MSSLDLGRIVPIYPLSDNVNIKTLRKAIYNAIQTYKDETYKDEIYNVVPEYLKDKYDLLDKKKQLCKSTSRNHQKMLEWARFTLVFEELFLVQLKLAQLRAESRKNNESNPAQD